MVYGASKCTHDDFPMFATIPDLGAVNTAPVFLSLSPFHLFIRIRYVP